LTRRNTSSVLASQASADARSSAPSSSTGENWDTRSWTTATDLRIRECCHERRGLTVSAAELPDAVNLLRTLWANTLTADTLAADHRGILTRQQEGPGGGLWTSQSRTARSAVPKTRMRPSEVWWWGVHGEPPVCRPRTAPFSDRLLLGILLGNGAEPTRLNPDRAGRYSNVSARQGRFPGRHGPSRMI